MKANAEVKEVVPPALNLTSQQLFWVGYAQDYCLLGGRFTEYKKLGELIDNYSVFFRKYLGRFKSFHLVRVFCPCPLSMESEHSNE